MNFSLFVSCPKGLEYLLETELSSLGLQVTNVSPQGVYGEATLKVIYQLCLWSRLANRIQIILFNGVVSHQQALYQLCHTFPWEQVFTPDKTLAIEFHGTTGAIRNEMFGAQVVKDAIVDYWREKQGIRPTIDRENPQIRLHAHLKHDQVTVSYDVSGYSLHQRGYRLEQGIAPLKENIAAAMLIRARWPELAAKGYALHDPFCGSGTLVIEAALMAACIAPGLLRQDQACQHWVQHQPLLWQSVREEAKQQIRPLTNTLWGTDQDSRAITMAKANAERATIADSVHFMPLSMQTAHTKVQASPGLLICNPPYGERLGNEMALIDCYQQLGQCLHRYYQGWMAAVLTSQSLLAKAIGLRAHKQYVLYNGALECKLYCFELINNQLRASGTTSNNTTQIWSASAQMFANRLQKNVQHLKKWATRQQISCYRVYDADLPEYAYAIDCYADYAVLQEYMAPATIALHLVEQRRLDVIQVTPKILGIPANHIICKQRQQQKGTNQYQRIKQTHQKLIVQEGQARLLVNLQDYLDTGLFLDHRLLRLRFAQLRPNTRFLNCFCYTATASVHAALAGALTTNVDLSNTYLSWAQDNFRLNQLEVARHQFIQYDCLQWLKVTRDQFDVIFLDPPSFSNSKRMEGTLDIQRDHVILITAAMRLLKPQGLLYFSTNLRQFRLAPELHQQFTIKDISRATIDVDFKRNQRIHHCYTLRH